MALIFSIHFLKFRIYENHFNITHSNSVPMLMTSETTDVKIHFIHLFISFETLFFSLLNHFKSHFHIIRIPRSMHMKTYGHVVGKRNLQP